MVPALIILLGEVYRFIITRCDEEATWKCSWVRCSFYWQVDHNMPWASSIMFWCRRDHCCRCCCCACRSLPLLHVTLRLEAIAGGLWPEPAEPAGDTTRVVMCLRGAISTAAKDSTSGVVAGAAL